MGALLAGSINVVSDSAFWSGAVRDGSLRLLAIGSSARRIPRYPETPTLNELGYEFDGTASLGIIGPRGIPEEALRPLQAAMRDAIQDPGARHLRTLRPDGELSRRTGIRRIHAAHRRTGTARARHAEPAAWRERQPMMPA